MKKIALCIGHSRTVEGGRLDGGAVGFDQATNEHEFNLVLAEALKSILERSGSYQVQIFKAYQGNSYGKAIAWLCQQVKDFGADVAVELHFNCSDQAASNGHEYLHWSRSARSSELAGFFDSAHRDFFPASRPRGNNGRVAILAASQRGGAFLKGTHCPAVITEPFFGSNPTEWQEYLVGREKLAQAYAQALQLFLT